MSQIPFVTFGLLLFGAGLSGLFVWRRRTLVWETAVATIGLATLIWLAVWPSLPVVILPVNANWTLPLAWQIDTANWVLTLVALIVGLAVLLVWRPPVIEPLSPYRFTLLLGLLAAVIVVLWAASLPAMMMGWTLFLVGWAVFLIVLFRQDLSMIGPRLFYFVASLCLLWLASAWVGNIVGWDVAIWPRPAVVAALLAGAVQVGVWPFFGWRLRRQLADPIGVFLLNMLPVLAGMMLLLRMAAMGDAGLVAGLLTVGALVHMLWGLYLFGLSDDAGQRMALAVTAVALPVLVALWTAPQFVMLEVRGYVLAVTILTLSLLRPIGRDRWWRLIPLLLAFATIAGMPLTATFVSRAALYEVWLDGGNVVLAIVLALLQVPLVTAVLVYIKNRQQFTNDAALDTRGVWLYDVALFLPVLGLFAVSNIAWTEIRLLTWALILLPMLAGVVLFYIMGRKGRREMPQVVKMAFAIQLPIRDGLRVGRELLKGVGTAVGEALAILEGETGLLWLVAIVLVIVLIS